LNTKHNIQNTTDMSIVLCKFYNLSSGWNFFQCSECKVAEYTSDSQSKSQALKPYGVETITGAGGGK